MTLAGWSTAAAAVTHVEAVRIQFQGTIGRQAPLACSPDALAFSVDAREHFLMRQADLGAPQIPANQLNPRSSQ